MQGKVESVGKSKSGKAWRVLIAGKYYGANFDSKLDSAQGRVIDFNFDDGQFGPWVKSWTYATDTPAQAPASAPSPANNPTGARLAEPELRFVSNLVASAITAGKITSPLEISVWAKAAANTVREL